jgi:hypothetical protein
MTLFPEPAENQRRLIIRVCQVRERASREVRTFAMYPKERTHRSPFRKGVTLGKPRRGPIVVLSERDVVICRSIWLAQPVSDFLLQLVTC